jgi:uncharacterized protein (TIGR02145 family)
MACLTFALAGCGGGDAESEGDTGTANELVDARDGHKYRTKQFGGQVWMAENLAFGEVTSKYPRVDSDTVPRFCPQTYPDPTTPSPCDLYGGYYTWATALALPRSCNGDDCATQIQSPHQGICPQGWHIPSKQDFETLTSFLATESGLTATYAKGYSELGRVARLAAACKTPPATDAPSAGFDGLPSGFANDTGYVSAEGVWTYWQTTMQDPGYSYGWGLSCNDDRFGEGFYYKSHGLPVRCLKD